MRLSYGFRDADSSAHRGRRPKHGKRQTINRYFTVGVGYRPSLELNQPGNDYRPGNSATFSVGVRYEENLRWIPQLQLNVTRKSADQGALADTTDTAGTVAYLSPGVTRASAPPLHVYAVLQVPVYSNLSGYQLFPHWTATAGVSYAFWPVRVIRVAAVHAHRMTAGSGITA